MKRKCVLGVSRAKVWSGCFRLLHSHKLAVIGLSVGYETWPLIGWHHHFMIGWSKFRLRLHNAPLHYGLTWSVGIPIGFQILVTVPLDIPIGRQMPAVRAVQVHCERIYTYFCKWGMSSDVILFSLIEAIYQHIFIHWIISTPPPLKKTKKKQTIKRGFTCTHSFMVFVSVHQGRTLNDEGLVQLANTKWIKLFSVLDIKTIKPLSDFFYHIIYMSICVYHILAISNKNAEWIFFPFAFRWVLWFGHVLHDTTCCIFIWLLVL